MEVIVMVFPKKFLFRTNGLFRTQNGASSQLCIRCKDCSTILHSEKCQERQGNSFNGFSERNVSQSNLLILEQKWHGFLIILDLLSGFLLILMIKIKVRRGTWKFHELFFEKKSHLRQFEFFKSFFNVWFGALKIEPVYCYNWIFKPLQPSVAYQ